MDDIVIYRKHGKTLAEARKSAERMAAELNEEFELNCAWQGNVLTFERLGVSGKLELDDQEVGVIVNLSFLLTALKPTIEREVHRFFDENFAT
ncbi:MAG: polyhydroxyalkanoic acid system family protein [Propionivibrio sp.]|jgi:putative polyhydroxyalkanoate system protein|nr:polyhydroxyalkanoic acid system family protein [Propionivibrio sp.]MBP6709855.1 polyhydroxyalkanoic acid system family protein [Propionivibrio sp.]MBP8163111.1 polyhydroxyalkanoic acid system family protein [Propionivibrio sp.]